MTAPTAIDFEHTYSQGTLNSGTIRVPINYNGTATENNFNLIGNPYPSAIDTDELIETNAAIDAVFFWDHLTDPSADTPGFNTQNFTMDDVSIRNNGMGIPSVNGDLLSAPGQFMVSGQGFGILGLQSEAANNTPVTFTNALRVAGNNGAVRSNESTAENRLWLSMKSANYGITSTTGISFTESGSIYIDSGLDTKRLNTSISLFSITDDEDQLAIQGRELFNETMQIDLGISSIIPEEELFTIGINQLEGFALSETAIFLIDHELGTRVNLKKQDYTFTASEGIDAARFTIAFTNTALTVTENSVLDSAITMYPNPATDRIVISSTGDQLMTRALITTINGKQVLEFTGTQEREEQIAIDTLSPGIYFVQIQTNKGTVVKKLIIQ